MNKLSFQLMREEGLKLEQTSFARPVCCSDRLSVARNGAGGRHMAAGQQQAPEQK
jgi:hypothetical protein